MKQWRNMSDRKQAAFQVEEHVYEAAMSKLEHGEMSQLLRDYVKEIAFGEDLSRREQIKRRLEQLRDTKSDIRSEITRLQNQEEKVQRKISQNELRLDNVNDKDAEYRGALETISEYLQSGARVTIDNPQVARAAEIGERSIGTVMGDLQELNSNVPQYAFEEPRDGEEPNWQHHSVVAP